MNIVIANFMVLK